MPSPIGHALGGLAAGWLIGGVPPGDGPGEATAPVPPRGGRAARLPWRDPRARSALWFSVLGVLPDVDFLFGTHSTYTHSLGAVVLVFVGVLAAAKDGRWTCALASAAAYATHVWFDWMGNDTFPPLGIMALWPLSAESYLSDARVFQAISRRYWLPDFWAHNLGAVAWEVTLLAPLVGLVVWLRRGRQGVRGRNGVTHPAAAAAEPASLPGRREAGESARARSSGLFSAR